MKSIVKTFSVIVLAALMLSGCMVNLGQDSYSSTAGQGGRAIKGVVSGARIVQVASEDNTAGTIIGGLTGAVAGSAIGQGRGSALGAIGGAVVGGALGNMAQKSMSRQQAIEYVVKTKQGMYTVVQGVSPPFNRGQHVLVMFGERIRIIADPDYSY